MAEQPNDEAARARDAERLKALETKLAQKTTVETSNPAGDKFSQAQMAWRMVTELVAGLVLGFGVGFGLDKLFGTTPVLMIIFVMLGFVAGIKTVIRTANEVGKTPGSPGDDKGE